MKEIINNIKNIIDKYKKDQYFSGTCLVTIGKETVFSTSCGYAHRGFKIRNNIDTRFDTASITKTFTAAAVLLLVQAGKLSLNDKITDIIDLKGTEIPDDVSIRHLLTYTSGIADDADEEAGENYSDLFITKPNYSLKETKDFLPQFVFKKPVFKAGTDVRYNNCGFILLGLALEKLTGHDYRSFVSDNVWKPLGMNDTAFLSMDGINENTAEGYTGCYDKDENIIGWKKNIYSYPPIGSPDSGAYTTVKDLDRFIRGLKEGRLLDRKHTEFILSPQCEYKKPFSKWEPVPYATIRSGFAFEFVEFDDKVFCMRKDGLNDGAAAMLSYYPKVDAAIIILCNQDCNIWNMHREIQTELYYGLY